MSSLHALLPCTLVLLALACGGPHVRDLTPVDLGALPAYPIARPVLRDETDPCTELDHMRPYRHYFSVLGVGAQAHFFTAVWVNAIGVGYASLAVIPEGGRPRVFLASGRDGDLLGFFPHAQVPLPPELAPLEHAATTALRETEPEMRSVQLTYGGAFRPVTVVDEMPVSLPGGRSRLRHTEVVIGLGELLRPPGAAPAARSVSIGGGFGLSCHNGRRPARTFLEFHIDDPEGSRLLPALLLPSSSEHARFRKALLQAVQRVLEQEPGPDPAALYPEPTVLPTALAQQVVFLAGIAMGRSGIEESPRRELRIPAAQALLSGVERTQELTFLGTPVQSRLRVEASPKVTELEPDDHGFRKVRLRVDWELRDPLGRVRRVTRYATGTAVVDGPRAALIDLRLEPPPEPLPTRRPTLIEQLRLDVRHW